MIIESALVLASLLVVLVSGLGLVATLVLNVFDRTREIGVLRAIGAAPRTIGIHVVVEAVLIGLASWCAAIVLALPASYLLERVTGQMFFRAPLDFTLSLRGALVWLAVVLPLAVVSGLYPAVRAARLAVREVLAYE